MDEELAKSIREIKKKIERRQRQLQEESTIEAAAIAHTRACAEEISEKNKKKLNALKIQRRRQAAVVEEPAVHVTLPGSEVEQPAISGLSRVGKQDNPEHVSRETFSPISLPSSPAPEIQAPVVPSIDSTRLMSVLSITPAVLSRSTSNHRPEAEPGPLPLVVGQELPSNVVRPECAPTPIINALDLSSDAGPSTRHSTSNSKRSYSTIWGPGSACTPVMTIKPPLSVRHPPPQVPSASAGNPPQMTSPPSLTVPAVSVENARSIRIYSDRTTTAPPQFENEQETVPVRNPLEEPGPSTRHSTSTAKRSYSTMWGPGLASTSTVMTIEPPLSVRHPPPQVPSASAGNSPQATNRTTTAPPQTENEQETVPVRNPLEEPDPLTLPPSVMPPSVRSTASTSAAVSPTDSVFTNSEAPSLSGMNPVQQEGPPMHPKGLALMPPHILNPLLLQLMRLQGLNRTTTAQPQSENEQETVPVRNPLEEPDPPTLQPSAMPPSVRSTAPTSASVSPTDSGFTNSETPLLSGINPVQQEGLPMHLKGLALMPPHVLNPLLLQLMRLQGLNRTTTAPPQSENEQETVPVRNPHEEPDPLTLPPSVMPPSVRSTASTSAAVSPTDSVFTNSEAPSLSGMNPVQQEGPPMHPKGLALMPPHVLNPLLLQLMRLQGLNQTTTAPPQSENEQESKPVRNPLEEPDPPTLPPSAMPPSVRSTAPTSTAVSPTDSVFTNSETPSLPGMNPVQQEGPLMHPKGPALMPPPIPHPLLLRQLMRNQGLRAGHHYALPESSNIQSSIPIESSSIPMDSMTMSMDAPTRFAQRNANINIVRPISMRYFDGFTSPSAFRHPFQEQQGPSNSLIVQHVSHELLRAQAKEITNQDQFNSNSERTSSIQYQSDHAPQPQCYPGLPMSQENIPETGPAQSPTDNHSQQSTSRYFQRIQSRHRNFTPSDHALQPQCYPGRPMSEDYRPETRPAQSPTDNHSQQSTSRYFQRIQSRHRNFTPSETRSAQSPTDYHPQQFTSRHPYRTQSRQSNFTSSETRSAQSPADYHPQQSTSRHSYRTQSRHRNFTPSDHAPQPQCYPGRPMSEEYRPETRSAQSPTDYHPQQSSSRHPYRTQSRQSNFTSSETRSAQSPADYHPQQSTSRYPYRTQSRHRNFTPSDHAPQPQCYSGRPTSEEYRPETRSAQSPTDYHPEQSTSRYPYRTQSRHRNFTPSVTTPASRPTNYQKYPQRPTFRHPRMAQNQYHNYTRTALMPPPTLPQQHICKHCHKITRTAIGLKMHLRRVCEKHLY